VSSNLTVDGDWLPATEWCQCYLPCWTSQKIWGDFLYGVYRPGE